MSTIIAAVIVSIAANVGYVSFYAVGPDNKVEEACEEVIKVGTGVDVDLSSDTPEKVITIESDLSADEQTDPVDENNQ